MNTTVQNSRCGAAIARLAGCWSLCLAGLLCLVGPQVGCQPATPAAPGGATMPSTASTGTPTGGAAPDAEKPRPAAGPVGDDPAASLDQLARQISEAFAKFDRVYKLIYPVGWVRQRLQTQEVRAQLVPGAPAAATGATVTVRYLDNYSVIRLTEAEAATAEPLYPRTPKGSEQAMLNNLLNAELQPTEMTIHYAIRDGQWVRDSWEGLAQRTQGNDFADQIGVP